MFFTQRRGLGKKWREPPRSAAKLRPARLLHAPSGIKKVFCRWREPSSVLALPAAHCVASRSSSIQARTQSRSGSAFCAMKMHALMRFCWIWPDESRGKRDAWKNARRNPPPNLVSGARAVHGAGDFVLEVAQVCPDERSRRPRWFGHSGWNAASRACQRDPAHR